MMNNRQGGEALLNFIASGFKKGGTVASKPVARFALGGSAGDFEGVDFGGNEDRNDDSSDLGGFGFSSEDIAEIGEATRGMSDSEREAAAQAAVDAMDRESGGDRDEQDRAITRLFEEEILKATQDNIAAMQGDAAAQARIDAITGAPTAAETLAAARGQPAVDPLIQEAVKAQALAQAARTTAPEPQETVTEKVIEQAVSKPIDFFDPRISAGIMSDSPQQFDVEQMRLANDLIARSTPAANQTPVTLDRPLQTDRSGYFRSGEYEVAPSAPAPAPAQPQPPAAPAGIEQVAPGINVQQEIDRFTAPVGVPSVNVPEGFSPREQLESRLNQFDIQQPDQKEMIDLPGGPYGRVASGLLNTIFNPTEDTRRAIAEGAEPVFADDGSGNIVGAYDAERGITYAVADERFNFSDMDENLRAAFEKSRLRREAERGDGGRGDDELILPEDVEIEEEVATPERPPTIDIIPFRPEDFYYFQQQPFSYTRQGLPSMMNMRRG